MFGQWRLEFERDARFSRIDQIVVREWCEIKKKKKKQASTDVPPFNWCSRLYCVQPVTKATRRNSNPRRWRSRMKEASRRQPSLPLNASIRGASTARIIASPVPQYTPSSRKRNRRIYVYSGAPCCLCAWWKRGPKGSVATRGILQRQKRFIQRWQVNANVRTTMKGDTKI